MKRLFRFIKALWRYTLYGNRVDFDVYVKRLEKCNACPNFNDANWTCKVCGCYMTKKAKMSTENCSENKW